MGTTIHYEFKSDAKGLKEARAQVEALRQKCMDLPFAEVGEIKVFKGKECDYENAKNGDDKWMLIQSAAYVNCRRDGRGIRELFPDEEMKTGDMSFQVAPKTVVAFEAWAGEGCESTNMGLVLLPKTTLVHVSNDTWNKRRKRLWVNEGEEWTWNSFTKTQYAEDFARAHLTVLSAMEAAQEVGLKVEVGDEGEYWKNRDLGVLVENNEALAGMIAAMAGAFKDAGMDVQSPITERPDFEHLEARGAASIKGTLQALVESIKNAEEAA